MPEPVMIIRGFPQSAFEHDPIGNESVLDDLKTLANLTDEQVRAVGQHLAKIEGFLAPKSLLAAIRETIPDLKTAEVVRRVLRSLDTTTAERLVTTLEQGRKTEGFPFDDASLARLKQILLDLVRPYPALARYEKAERLARTVGQPLESIELICDLRPIFNEGRDYLEGLMPYTRLRITATGEDGLPRSFEAQLTYQQVYDLAEKAEKAKRKIDTLRQSVEKWLPTGLPDLPLTRVPREEPSDD